MFFSKNWVTGLTDEDNSTGTKTYWSCQYACGGDMLLFEGVVDNEVY